MAVRQQASPLAGVQTIPHMGIELPDGVRLSARVWLPADAHERPVPAILMADPYRKTDGTAERDARIAPFFAERGHSFVRLDIRGSGDSEGILEDEYLPREQADNVAVVEWLAQQPWCSGRVGMIGLSWSGFAALQAAARAPEPLGGVIAIHCSDDRYADDVHYFGGCVLALDMLQWATSMLAYLGQPPDPRLAGPAWRERWLERLELTPPFIDHWLGHQRRDDYWSQGSVREAYSAIRCPVLAVGGWSDGYRDAVLRLVEHLPGPARGVIGPWGHTWPDAGAPGPPMEFLAQCVRFFDHVLADVENGFFDEPRLLVWMQEAVAPAPSYEVRPGRWVAEPSWPSPNVEMRTLRLAGERLLDTSAAGARQIRGLQATGIEGGVWCGDGGPADAPLDQRPDDGASLCYDSEPLSERLELLGHVRAVLEVSVDRPLALVAVRVCDVAQSGASTLIARGVLNLTHRDRHDRVVPAVAGERMCVEVALQSTAYAIPAGHRLRLAISPTYWPWAWPSPDPVTLSVHAGGESRVELPVRGADDGPGEPPFDPPATLPAVKVERSGGAPTRRIVRDIPSGSVEVEFDWTGDGMTTLPDGTALGERNVTRYRIVEGDPRSASVDCEVSVSLERGDWRVRTEVASSLAADCTRFRVETRLAAYEGDERVFARTYDSEIPRDGG